MADKWLFWLGMLLGVACEAPPTAGCPSCSNKCVHPTALVAVRRDSACILQRK